MVACDSLSRLEIEAESKIVNPILKDLSGSMKKIIKMLNVDTNKT